MESGHWIIPANERFIMGAECESLLPEKGEESRLVRRARRGSLTGVCLGWYAGKEKRRIGAAYEEEAVWRLTERF